MLRGLLSLFTSGLIIHPMVLLGIGSGIYLSLSYNLQEIYAFMAMPLVYLVVVVIALLYTLKYNRVHKSFSEETDWKETFSAFIGNIFKLLISCACAISLYTMFFL